MKRSGWDAIRGATALATVVLAVGLVVLMAQGAAGIGCAPSAPFPAPGDCAFQYPLMVFGVGILLVLSLCAWWLAARMARRARG